MKPDWGPEKGRKLEKSQRIQRQNTERSREEMGQAHENRSEVLEPSLSGDIRAKKPRPSNNALSGIDSKLKRKPRSGRPAELKNEDFQQLLD